MCQEESKVEGRKIALAGNPNCGKTTLFNGLTGANHYVGNWAGVTVERKEGTWHYADNAVHVIDLPGIYSMSPYSLEERISRDFIINSDIDVVVNVVDASFLERNLYLTTQLIELGKPVVVVLNMMDEAERKGITIDVEGLSKDLGVPVVPMIAMKGIGVDALYRKLYEVVTSDKKYPIKVIFEEEVEQHITEYATKYGKCLDNHYDPRWVGIKVIEEDSEVLDLLGIDSPKVYESGVSIITTERYKYIDALIAKHLVFGQQELHKKSDSIDNILLNKRFALPIFALVMAFIFYMTFTVGGIFTDRLDVLINEVFAGVVRSGLTNFGVDTWLISLVVDGIIGGVGGVLTFVPNIAILFLFISLLEDSGYMARVALIMDGWMSRVGLNGKTFIPMILGFGCNVPAIMGTRTLENENDRLIAILTNPFMSCGARFPVYVLFASIFFKGYEALVTFSLYFLGVVIALVVAYIFRRTLFKGEESPFVMELPPYRIPGFKSLMIHVWERVKDYIQKAGTVIFLASVIIWVILNFNMNGMTDIQHSFGASIGRVIAPVFAPLGFGTWQSALSLLSGIVAKEIVVANTAILYGVSGAGMDGLALVLKDVFNPVSAYAFLVFVLLYTPCVAVIGVIKRETNSWKWTIFSVCYQIVIAWTVSFVFYQVGSFLFL
jgi:ferrous iron transport protein B